MDKTIFIKAAAKLKPCAKYALTAASIGLALLTGLVESKQLDEKVEKRVNEALAERNNEES